MISRTDTLNMLKKYGYNSMNVHPFIYSENNVTGINYSYIDDIYGIVERLAIFNSEADLNLFLKRYQWYKLNGKSNNVHLELDNYEVKAPKIIYTRNGHVMTDGEMFDIKSYDQKIDRDKKLSHTKRIVAEISDLLNHYYLKKDEIIKYINNFLNKEAELKRYYSELQKLVNKYNHKEYELELIDNINDFNIFNPQESELNIKLAKLKDENPKESEAYKLLDNVWQLNKSLELNKDYLNAVQKNDDLDEEMRLVITKIDYMKELLAKKRYWFTSIVNLKSKFNNIDSSSTYKSVYDDTFTTKMNSFINEKYEAKNKIDEFKLCEYLDDFIGNNEYDIIKNTQLCQSNSNNEENHEELFNTISEDLTRQFNDNLTEEEQNALILYSSLYKDIINMILNINFYNDISVNKLINLLNITDGFLKTYEEAYTNIKSIISLDINKDIKNTIFKDINFNNKESFIKSLKNIINIISNINTKLKLNYNCNLYFSTTDINTINKETFINMSNNIGQFINNNGNNRIIIANISQNINVLFSPKIIELPVSNINNQKIAIIEDQNAEITIDLKDVQIIKDNNNTIFANYKSNMVKLESYTYVNSFNLNYTVNINRIKIEKRNNNE
jgi:hypothetical protein